MYIRLLGPTRMRRAFRSVLLTWEFSVLPTPLVFTLLHLVCALYSRCVRFSCTLHTCYMRGIPLLRLIERKDPSARIDFQFDEAGFDFKALPFTIPYPVPFRWLGDEVRQLCIPASLAPHIFSISLM